MLRHIQFTTHCRCEEGRFKIGDIVRLPAQRVIELIYFGHGVARHDLDEQHWNDAKPVEPAVTKPARAVTKPITQRETKEPSAYEGDTHSEATHQSRLRDDWLSLAQALAYLGWSNNAANVMKLKSAISSNALRGEIREGLRPTYQIDKTSLRYYKQSLKGETK